MSVLTGFFIIIMLILVVYTVYRMLLRRELPMLIAVCAQLFAISIAVLSFSYNLLHLIIFRPAFYCLVLFYLLFFLFYDYRKLILKFKNTGDYKGLIEPVPKTTDGKTDDGSSEEPGRLMVLQGRYAEAINYYKSIIDCNPDDHKAYTGAANVYIKLNN